MRRLTVLCSAVALVLALAPAASAASGRSDDAVTAVHVRHASSTSVTLAWTNPGDSTGTVVRYAAGRHAPTTSASAHSGGRVGRGHRSITLTALRSGTTYSVALFALTSGSSTGPRTTLRVATAPGAVRNLIAYDDGATTLITWQAPARGRVRSVIVRYTGGYVPPRTSHSGHGARVGAHAHSVRLRHLVPGGRYAVSLFALDAAGRASTPAITRFVTLTDPRRQGQVTGRVVDATGQPLLGVDVDVQTIDSEANQRTGADGRFSLTAPAGPIDVSFNGQHIVGGVSDTTGYLPAEREGVVRAGHTASLGNVALASGSEVRGRAVNATGAGVSGLPIVLLPVLPYARLDVDSGSGFGVALLQDQPRTASDGSYVVRGVPSGSALRACAIVQTDLNCSRLAAIPHSRRIIAGPTIRVTTPPGTGSAATGSIAGRIIARGRGVVGAQVYAFPTDDGEDAFSGTSGADGRYRLPGVVPGHYAVCAAAPPDRATGLVPTCSRPVTVTASHTTNASVVLLVAAGLAGVVKGPDGRAVPDAVVSAEPVSGDGPESETTSDAQGRYRVVGLSSQPQKVCARPTHVPRSEPTGLRLTCTGSIKVRAGLTRADTDVRVAVGAAIKGRVVDTSGRPLSGVTVAAFPQAEPSSPDASVGGDDGDDDGGDDTEVVTGADGRYLLAGLTGGKYGLCATYTDDEDGDSTCSTGTVTAVVGHTTATSLRLPVTATLAVTVRDSSGNPVAGVDAVAFRACATPIRCASQPVELLNNAKALAVAQDVTDAAGHATLYRVSPARYAVCLYAYYGTTTAGGPASGYADGCSGSTFSITVTAHHRTAVAVTLLDGGVVSGRVTSDASQPLANAAVTVSGSATTDFPGAGSDEDDSDDGDDDSPTDPFAPPGALDVTAQDGTYTITGVRPGQRTVCADATSATGGSSPTGYANGCYGASSSAPNGTPVTVTADATTSNVTIALAPASKIAGRVVDRLGKGLSNTEVGIFAGRDADADPVDVAETTKTGQWTSAPLPPGNYTVCFVNDTTDEDDDLVYLGQCWKKIDWDAEGSDPPLARATLITTSSGVLTSGINATLRPVPN